MQKMLRAMAFVGLAVLSGCGGSGQDVGAILWVGGEAEVQGLDPHLVTGMTEHRILSMMFEGLTDIDLHTLEPVPAAAESWTVSEDGLVYTFRLRENGRWSNGELITAQDFVYSWRRILSPTLGAEYAYLLHCIKNARAFNVGELDDFAQVGVKAVDRLTLEVTLEHPTPYFLTVHAHQAWYPVCQAAIEAHGAMDGRNAMWTRPGNLVSNGPFVLTDWIPGEIIRVRRNPNYWDAAHVRLDGINARPIEDTQTEEREFRVGGLHMTADVPQHKVQWYKENQPDLLVLHPYIGSYFYRLNTTRPPFDDVRVRRAFQLAVDRKELVENVLKAGEQPAHFFTPPGLAGYTCMTRVEFDPERARALLAEAGYPNGAGLPPIDILYNTSDNHKLIAEAIQRMWKQYLNVEVKLLNQDWKVYLVSMNELEYDVARSAWIADFLDPVNFLECFLTGGGNNRTGYASAAYDQLIQAAYAETDRQARLAVLQQAEKMLLDDGVIIPIYFYVWKFLKKPEVGGVVPNLLGQHKWKNLYLDSAGN